MNNDEFNEMVRKQLSTMILDDSRPKNNYIFFYRYPIEKGKISYTVRSPAVFEFSKVCTSINFNLWDKRR